MPPEADRRRRGRPHYRALESLYRHGAGQPPVRSRLEIVEQGFARIRFDVDEQLFHAAGAAHGTLYFKMLDDAAFYACNSLVTDRFLLTTAFNLLFTRPLRAGPVIAEGRWASGRRRVFVGEARLIDAEGEEAARGTGTFMRSHIPLSGLPGYAPADEPRLASSVLVGALIRKAEARGRLRARCSPKAMPTAGSILVMLLERGGESAIVRAHPAADGDYAWQDSGSQALDESEEVPEFVARRRRFDPDLWVVELDIPSAERFAAEMNAFD